MFTIDAEGLSAAFQFMADHAAAAKTQHLALEYFTGCLLGLRARGFDSAIAIRALFEQVVCTYGEDAIEQVRAAFEMVMGIDMEPPPPGDEASPGVVQNVVDLFAKKAAA